MSTTYVWSEHRDRLIDASGDAPSAELEQRLLTAFEQHPALVVAGIEHIIGRYQRGLVRAPWVVLAKHVEETAATSARGTVPVRDERDRERARQRAAQWMRAAGVHFPTEDEIRDELFGYHGMLRQFARDDELVEELVDLWRELRPIGEQLDAEADGRGRAFVQHRARVAAATTRSHRPGSETDDATMEAAAAQSWPRPPVAPRPQLDEIDELLASEVLNSL